MPVLPKETCQAVGDPFEVDVEGRLVLAQVVRYMGLAVSHFGCRHKIAAAVDDGVVDRSSDGVSAYRAVQQSKTSCTLTEESISSRTKGILYLERFVLALTFGVVKSFDVSPIKIRRPSLLH
jgi:hypothetical protein